MNNAGIEKELNAGAAAPEEVIEGTPEITEDNLFDLVHDGIISIEKANEWIAEQEKAADDVAEVSAVEEPESNEKAEVVSENNKPAKGGVESSENKPFRVYNTQEEFQRDFDRSWDKRYGKQKEESERKDREHNELISDLAELLGVTPENAPEELKRRKLARQADREGKDVDDLYEIDKLRTENEQYKKQEETRKAEAVVADINAQGAAISKIDPSFDINEAMKNPEFRRQVFFTRQTNPERAVEIAYKLYYGDKTRGMAPAQTTVPQRPPEGAATAATTGARKPVDYTKLSSEDIRALDKKMMRGEKIEI